MSDLDALVAQHVFEWEFREIDWITTIRRQGDGTRTTMSPPSGICGHCGRYLFNMCGGECDGKKCRFSESIGQAWPVVEKMRDQGRDIRITMYGGDPAETFVTVSIESQTDGYGSTETVHAMESTAPHAICLAALKALEVEV